MKNVNTKIKLLICILILPALVLFPQNRRVHLRPQSRPGRITNFHLGNSVQSVTPPSTMLQKPDANLIVGSTVTVSDKQFFSVDQAPYGLLGRSETAIASSIDGKKVVIGYNDANGFLEQLQYEGLSGFAFSADGGNTFTSGNPLPLGYYNGQPVVTRGDPWLDSGPGGQTFFFSNMASLPIGLNLADVGISVHKGVIAGGNIIWSQPAIFAEGPNDYFDKDALAADKNPGSGWVYVSLTNFINYNNPDLYIDPQIEVYGSSDGGKTFTGPAIVQPPNLAGDQGTAPVVGPDGTVYLTWEEYNYPNELFGTGRIQFASSNNHGASFTSPGTVTSFVTGEFNPPVAFNRTSSNNFPRIAVDRTQKHYGRIYVVYHDVGNNPPVHTDGVYYNQETGEIVAPIGGVYDSDIYLRYSDDKGAHWSSPVLVSSRTPGDGKAQFYPTVSVDQNGNVSVVYYQDTEVQSNPVNPTATDTYTDAYPIGRRSSYQSLVDVYIAVSGSGGSSFATPVRVNDVTSNWSVYAANIIPNYGDYIASVSTSNLTLTSYAQNHLYEVVPGVYRMVPSAAFTKITVLSASGKDINVAGTGTSLPKDFQLYENYPNPFNPSTNIKFDLSEASPVFLKVYNIQGQEVASIYNGEVLQAGSYNKSFSADNMSSGIYLLRLSTKSFQSTKKMVLLK